MSQTPKQQSANSAFWRCLQPRIIRLLLTILVSLMIFRNWPTSPPETIGLHNGRLTPCPSSPNCVCSQDTDPSHSIAPIPLAQDPQRQWNMLQQLIQQQPRARIVTTKDDYLHAEFRSFVFQFVDDVEFLVDRDAQVIHIRSASRLGYSDLGVNRKRVEQLRLALQLAMESPTG